MLATVFVKQETHCVSRISVLSMCLRVQPRNFLCVVEGKLNQDIYGCLGTVFNCNFSTYFD